MLPLNRRTFSRAKALNYDLAWASQMDTPEYRLTRPERARAIIIRSITMQIVHARLEPAPTSSVNRNCTTHN